MKAKQWLHRLQSLVIYLLFMVHIEREKIKKCCHSAIVIILLCLISFSLLKNLVWWTTKCYSFNLNWYAVNSYRAWMWLLLLFLNDLNSFYVVVHFWIFFLFRFSIMKITTTWRKVKISLLAEKINKQKLPNYALFNKCNPSLQSRKWMSFIVILDGFVYNITNKKLLSFGERKNIYRQRWPWSGWVQITIKIDENSLTESKKIIILFFLSKTKPQHSMENRS